MPKRSCERILFFYRSKDTSLGLTRETALKMAEKLNMNETELIHLALAKLSTKVDSMYPIDDGPLTKKHSQRVQTLANSLMPKDEPILLSHLFENVEAAKSG